MLGWRSGTSIGLVTEYRHRLDGCEVMVFVLVSHDFYLHANNVNIERVLGNDFMLFLQLFQ